MGRLKVLLIGAFSSIDFPPGPLALLLNLNHPLLMAGLGKLLGALIESPEDKCVE